MLTELSVALEQAGVPVAGGERPHQGVRRSTTCAGVVGARGRAPPAEAPRREATRDEARRPSRTLEIPVPDAVADAGPHAARRSARRALYGGVFDVKVTGKAFIPQNRNFLVIANHASHLDMGLVKVALGEQGERLAALAARDYFFDTPLKRAYFENFTNLIPMDRARAPARVAAAGRRGAAPGLQPAHLPRGHALAGRRAARVQARRSATWR